MLLQMIIRTRHCLYQLCSQFIVRSHADLWYSAVWDIDQLVPVDVIGVQDIEPFEIFVPFKSCDRFLSFPFVNEIRDRPNVRVRRLTVWFGIFTPFV